MKLYSLAGTTSISNETHGEFEAEDDGAFEVPDELGQSLHGTHFAGKPAWETESERRVRLMAEEETRRRDPATLLAAVEAMTAQRDLVGSPKPAAKPAPKK